MGKKHKKEPPVSTERDLRARERAREDESERPQAPDGVSGDWG